MSIKKAYMRIRSLLFKHIKEYERNYYKYHEGTTDALGEALEIIEEECPEVLEEEK